jgi:hypothetical protein
MAVTREMLAAKFGVIFARLDERQFPAKCTAGRGELHYRADRHMDAHARLIGEPVKFGRGVVAERGSRASA